MHSFTIYYLGGITGIIDPLEVGGFNHSACVGLCHKLYIQSMVCTERDLQHH